MTKSWIEVQSVRNLHNHKNFEDLLIFRKGLRVKGYGYIKFVALGFPTQFPLKSKF